MKKPITQIGFLIIFLILIACQKDSIMENVLSPDDDRIENRAKKKHPVPFHATFVSTVSVFPPQPNEDVCGVGAPVFNLLQSLEGNATHMGLISGSISSCIDPTTGTIYNAVLTLIAANGDTIVFEGSGAIGGNFDVVSGTGRFVDASGSVAGIFQLIEGAFPPSFQTELNGEIQY